MAIKKLTPEYVEAQTLPFEAWYHGMDEKPIKAIVMQYNTYAGASVKTIEWRLVGEDGQSPHLSLIHISEPTRPCGTSRMPSSA